MENLQLNTCLTKAELEQYVNQEFPQFLNQLYDSLEQSSYNREAVIDLVNDHITDLLNNLGIFEVIQ